MLVILNPLFRPTLGIQQPGCHIVLRETWFIRNLLKIKWLWIVDKMSPFEVVSEFVS